MSDDYLGSVPGDGPDPQKRAGAREPSAGAAALLGVRLGDVEARVGEVEAGLGELRGQQDQILAAQDEIRDAARGTNEQVAGIGEAVEAVSAALEGLGGSAEGSPPPPVDWVHVPVGERAEWLADLAVWVRDVLFVQWPHTQDRIKPCWTLHMGLISDLRLLYQGYLEVVDGGEFKFMAGEHWRRTLEWVLARAAETTKGCPPPDSGKHAFPAVAARDDTASATLMAVYPKLRRAYDLMGRADEYQAAAEQETDPQTRRALQERAEELAAQSQEVYRSAAPTPQQQQAFVALVEGEQTSG